MEWVYTVAIIAIVVVIVVLILFFPERLKKFRLLIQPGQVGVELEAEPEKQDELSDNKVKVITELARSQVQREKNKKVTADHSPTLSDGQSGVHIKDTLGIESNIDASTGGRVNIDNSTLYGSSIRTQGESNELEEGRNDAGKG